MCESDCECEGVCVCEGNGKDRGKCYRLEVMVKGWRFKVKGQKNYVSKL